MNEIHFHRRNLPHIYIPERTYFITFRLKGSLPQNIINELRSNADRLSALLCNIPAPFPVFSVET